eukprot:11107969-Karenia_brevis.AAC.1
MKPQMHMIVSHLETTETGPDRSSPSAAQPSQSIIMIGTGEHMRCVLVDCNGWITAPFSCHTNISCSV